jgi:hypothetical protein
MGLDRATPAGCRRVAYLGEPARGDGREQRGVDLRVGAARGDVGVVADPGDGPGAVPAVEQGGYVIVSRGGGAERGGGDERPVSPARSRVVREGHWSGWPEPGCHRAAR